MFQVTWPAKLWLGNSIFSGNWQLKFMICTNKQTSAPDQEINIKRKKKVNKKRDKISKQGRFYCLKILDARFFRKTKQFKLLSFSSSTFRIKWKIKFVFFEQNCRLIWCVGVSSQPFTLICVIGEVGFSNLPYSNLVFAFFWTHQKKKKKKNHWLSNTPSIVWSAIFEILSLFYILWKGYLTIEDWNLGKMLIKHLL